MLVSTIALTGLFATTALTVVDNNLATFDDVRPDASESIDTQTVMERGAITCLGPLPTFSLPERPQSPNYRGFTLQQLCAKAIYGGMQNHHVGAYCSPMYSNPRYVSFDHRETTQISEELNNPRFLFYCRSRCHCAGETDDPTVQPFELSPLYGTWHLDAKRTYAIAIDRDDDYLVPEDAHRGIGDEIVDVTWLPITTEDDPVEGRQQLAVTMRDISIVPENRVSCQGPLPQFPLPLPAGATNQRGGTFRDLQHLCAVQLSGGNLNANAGAYCHRNGDDVDVWFTDDMTPRLEWTWDNFAASVMIRYHCWKHCTCSGEAPPENRTLASLWQFLPDFMLEEQPDGSVNVSPTASEGTSGQASTVTIPVLPARGQKRPRPAGTCGADGSQFCPMAWPSDVLGPKPVAPPPDQTSTLNADTPAQAPQCGTECTSNRACRAPGSPPGCRCVAASVDKARAKGLDPVFPKAFCLIAIQGLVHTRPKQAGAGNAGRSLPDSNQTFSEAWACACNQTYVSEGCCGSETGMIWESGEKKLGRLMVDGSA
ncbi:MAG: hypothetical protein M1817_002570 [Caeruleum heppii]|nr:MAG: hypothetical protein M1817_002570 [Caeruleum heppii]